MLTAQFLAFLFFFHPGSGKTYTMMGSTNQKGIIPRLCDELFDKISKVQCLVSGLELCDEHYCAYR